MPVSAVVSGLLSNFMHYIVYRLWHGEIIAWAESDTPALLGAVTLARCDSLDAVFTLMELIQLAELN